MSSNILTLGCDWQRVAGRSGRVYAYDDDGKQLDAKYEVEQDGEGLALILASASGKSGERPATNTQYRDALLVLLQRLKDLGAILDDAIVDSAYMRRQAVPEDQRRIIDPPVPMSAVADVAELRRKLQYGQSHVGGSPTATRPGESGCD